MRTFRKYISLYMYDKAGFTIRNAVVSYKDPLNIGEQCGVILVYECACDVCDELYVETGQSLRNMESL